MNRRPSASTGLNPHYSASIRRFTPLSRQQEAELAARIQAGDQVAREALAQANLAFVVSIALRYQHRGLILDELVSAGNEGLMKAVDRFDPSRGCKFITYAVWWIRQALQDSLSKQSRLIRLPFSRVTLLQVIKSKRHLLNQSAEIPLDTAEIAEAFALSEDLVQDMVCHVDPVLSLDTPQSDEDGPTLLDGQSDPKQEPPDVQVERDIFQFRVQQALGQLDEREQLILRSHFGFDKQRPQTLTEIGGKLGVTRERVRQLKERALAKLRRLQRVHMLWENQPE